MDKIRELLRKEDAMKDKTARERALDALARIEYLLRYDMCHECVDCARTIREALKERPKIGEWKKDGNKRPLSDFIPAVPVRFKEKPQPPKESE